MRHVRATATAAAIGLTALTLAACGGNQTSEPDITTPPATNSVAAASTSTTTAPEEVTSVESALAALATAADAVPDGQPFDLEVEVIDGQLQFEAKVASNGDQFDLVIDATGQDVVSHKQSDRPDDDLAKLDGTTVTATQALETASGKDTGARFAKLEIDTNDARTVVWEVELVGADGIQTECTIDAHTGEVLSP